MRYLVLAVLLLATPAFAQAPAQDADGIPGAGATVTLKPTAAGYAADIVLPAAKYTAAKVSSQDPAIANDLAQRVETQEETVAAPPAPADANKGSAAPADASKVSAAPADQGQPAKETAKEPVKTTTATFVRLVTVLLNSGTVPQGQYRFTLKLEGAAPLTRNLMLAVPASHVDAIDTLVVLDQWGKLHGPSTTANQPQIWETSQKGWLTGLTLSQKGETDAGTDPAGRIKVNDASIADLAPGKNALIRLGTNYGLEGPFPLGTAKGKLVLKAAQLSDPVTFNFEVRSRVWVVWLFAPIIIGLLFGYGARTWLANRLAVAQERKKCYDLIAQIDDALKKYRDAGFRTDADAARAHAVVAAAKKTAADVKTGTDAARTEFQAAVTALTARLTDLTQKVADLSAVTRADYHVPKAIKDALLGARDTIADKITSESDLSDVTTATANLAKLRLALCNVTLATGKKWAKDAAALDDVIDALGPALGLGGLGDLKSKIDAAVALVRKANGDLNNDTARTTASLKAALEALNANIYVLKQFSDALATAVTRQVAGLAQILSGKPLPKPDDWNGWLNAARACADMAGNLAPENPDTGALLAAVQNLAAALAKALDAQVASAAVRGPIDALLQQGKVTDAVTAVAQAVGPATVTADGRMMGTAPGGVTTTPTGGEAPQSVQVPTATPAQPLVYASNPRLIQPDASAILRDQESTEREIETAGILQTLIFGVVIAGSGYLLFSGTWIGTPMDFAVALFWGFGTDIGADAATTAAKAIKKPGQ